MSVSVLIPYGYRSEWDEALAFFVVNRWQKFFPGWEVIIGDGGSPFNRSAARNDAAAQASGDVFVVCDSDTTFFNPGDIQHIVDATTEKTWWLPREYLQTTRSWAQGFVNGEIGPADVQYDRCYTDQPGGWRVCSASAYRSVGGFDEGFRGWGYEDTAFVKALTATVGPPKRGGIALHLWHETSRSERQEQNEIGFNLNRFRLYHRSMLEGPGEMQRLLRELGVKK